MILLTGITGTLGGAIQACLTEFPQLEARAIARDPTKVTQPSLEVVPGDLRDADSVSVALKGIDKVCLLMANCEDQAEVEASVIDAAKVAGVKHLVKLSAIGADRQSSAVLKRLHGESEEHLRQSGLTHTIVRPNFFMSNLMMAQPTISTDDAIYWPMAKASVGAVDIADVAHFLLTVLTSDGHADQLYDISGPDVLSFAEIADQMSQVIGRPIRYVDIPNAAFKEAMKKAGVPPWYVNAVGDLFAMIARGDSAVVTPTFQKVTGRPPTPLRAYLERVKDAF